MTRTRMLSIAAIVALVALLGACSAGDMARDSDEVTAAPQDFDTSTDDAAFDSPDSDDAADEAEAPAGIGGEAGAPPASGADPLPTAQVARSAERIIKEGRVTIEVEEDGYSRAFDRVVSAATSLGGAVVSSTSETDDEGVTTGTVTVRVPVERYEDLLVGVGDIGTLRRQNITSTDVTAEYTDLQSRLRHARAQEAFYLELLEEAQGVQDAIAVKQQLDQIQYEIEQAQGRLNVLEDRTSFSTLAVELLEPGAAPIRPLDERPAIAEYLDIAVDGFITVVGSLIVIVVALAPLALIAGLVLLAWRAYRRRPRPATVAAEPPSA
jgi:hypothetical protein